MTKSTVGCLLGDKNTVRWLKNTVGSVGTTEFVNLSKSSYYSWNFVMMTCASSNVKTIPGLAAMVKGLEPVL